MVVVVVVFVAVGVVGVVVAVYSSISITKISIMFTCIIQYCFVF